jgi:hypothetical protein
MIHACVHTILMIKCNVCRTFVETAVNVNTPYSRCAKLFNDILQSSYARRAQWSATSNHKGGVTVLLDAQGAMLVLQRVRDLVEQGTWDADCRQRTDKIEAMLRELCGNELGNGTGSRKGFNAKKRLAEIEEDCRQREADKQNTSKAQESDDGEKYGGTATADDGVPKHVSVQHSTEHGPRAVRHTERANVEFEKSSEQPPAERHVGKRLRGNDDVGASTAAAGVRRNNEKVRAETQEEDASVSARVLRSEIGACETDKHDEVPPKKQTASACSIDAPEKASSDHLKHTHAPPTKRSKSGPGKDRSEELSPDRFVHLHVEGLAGINTISRASKVKKLEVLVR